MRMRRTASGLPSVPGAASPALWYRSHPLLFGADSLDPLPFCPIEPLACWAANYSFSSPVTWPSDCALPFLGMCLVIPAEETAKIFGFAQFISAFSLLLLIYTLAGVRYDFRIATAPIPLRRITFYV